MTKKARIYLGSSWKNQNHDVILRALERAGHSVYNYREHNGFQWKQIDTSYELWSPRDFAAALDTDLAKQAYQRDRQNIEDCDVLVAIFPGGRSLAWELGYATGLGRPTIILMLDKCEPELMYSESQFVFSATELLEAIQENLPA